MWRNHLKIATRKLLKTKLNTAIHVFGLAIGIACCLVIFLFVQYHLKFDQHWSNADHIFRVNMISEEPDGLNYGANTPYVMAEALRNELADLPNIGQVHLDGEVAIQKANGEKYKTEALFADGSLFEMFDFAVLNGDAVAALNQPGYVVLTETLANKLYPNEQPVGQTVTLGGKLKLTVGAVMQDLPKTSHLRGELMASMASFSTDYFGIDITSWGTTLSGSTYVQLGVQESPENYRIALADFAGKYMISEEDQNQVELVLQPLREIHFDQRYDEGGFQPAINPLYLWFFSALGVLILIVACINFINLSTAQSVQRAQEIGIRKVVGARQPQLIGQFIGETFLVTLLAVSLSVLLVEVALPFFNQSFDLPLALHYLDNPLLVLFLMVLTFLVTILAGIYPALVIARFRPALAIKTGVSGNRSGGSLMRKGLVIVQFCISTLLVIGALAIGQQLHYFQQKNLGFNQEAILVMSVSNQEKLDALREAWLRDAEVRSVSFALGAPTSRSNIGTSLYLSPDNQADWVKVSAKTVDGYYFDTYGLTMAAGRPLNPSDDRKVAQSDGELPDYPMVINEKLAHKLGYADASDALDQTYRIGVNNINGHIVGVVKDFHMQSLHEQIAPLIMLPLPGLYFGAGVKVNTSDLDGTISHLKEHWEQFNEGNVFEYEFLDERIRELYDSENQLLSLFGVLAGLAVLIACLGLWGLIVYITQQKTKEIGVRKVLGASVMQIINLLTKEFSGLVLLGFLVATPLAYLGLSRWLENFAYHIQLSPGLFVLSGVVVFVIALLTVSYHAYRAATANPAQSLKTE